MKRKSNMEKNATTTKILIPIATILIASVVAASEGQIPQASATSSDEIRASRDVSSPIEKVWSIVSDIDNESRYWSTVKNIRNINTTANNMTANTTEREATIVAGPRGDTLSHQFVTVNPEQFAIMTNITEGPLTGTRLLTLSNSSNMNTTRIDVVWNLDLSGIPLIGRTFVQDGIMRTTEDALQKISAEIETR
jgi:uncharacterized protein YndB with AHSA1/START domain